jgi:hypothetical protein
MQRDDAKRLLCALLEPRHCQLEPRPVERAALLAPGTNRAQPGDDEVLGGVERLRGAEHALPRRERPGEPGRHRVRDVVIARDDEEWEAEPSQERRGVLKLGEPSAVREIAGCDEELGLEVRDQRAQRGQRLPRLRMSHVQVGEVEKAGGHRRGRLYTQTVADESPELFDDIYLGLRAGGAARKQRRGEPLSNEEEEAISRWRRLSLWRKAIAVGAFALGTFGLGFTVGGLVFGRWRKA